MGAGINPALNRNVTGRWCGRIHAGTYHEPVNIRMAEEHICTFDLWIPLHRTYVESLLAMGLVIFRTVTRAMMDECQARIPGHQRWGSVEGTAWKTHSK
jgi:hypothetical protein